MKLSDDSVISYACVCVLCAKKRMKCVSSGWCDENDFVIFHFQTMDSSTVCFWALLKIAVKIFFEKSFSDKKSGKILLSLSPYYIAFKKVSHPKNHCWWVWEVCRGVGAQNVLKIVIRNFLHTFSFILFSQIIKKSKLSSIWLGQPPSKGGERWGEGNV